MNLFADKQQGAMLLITLLILSILGLLVLSQMQVLLMYYHSLNQLIEKQQTFYQLEREAYVLATTNVNSSGACLISEQTPEQLLLLLKNKQGCKLSHKQQQFYYLVEDLGAFPCLQIHLNHQAYSTVHQRITLFSEQPISAFMQLRFAHSAPLTACMAKELHVIKPGLLSWRYWNEG